MQKIRLLLAVLMVVTGIAGFYLLGDMPAVVRLLSVVAGLVAALAVIWSTPVGRDGIAFAKDSIAEARRVSWPSRKETMQTTGVVFALVLVMAIFMWVVDLSLLYAIKVVMGRAD